MRIIATLLCVGTKVVQAYGYSSYRDIGSPLITVKHLDLWGIDEIVLLQIDNSFESLLLNIESIASISTTPITIGGGIDSLHKAERVIQSGADRLCMQSIICSNYDDLVRCAKTFGGQSITLKFDFSSSSNQLRAFGCDWNSFMADWWPKILDLRTYDIEEVFLNSIDSDGLIQPPRFHQISLDMFLDYSVILGGGISDQNIDILFRQLSPSVNSLSFSLSNYFYQKEVASSIALQKLIGTSFNHRFSEELT